MCVNIFFAKLGPDDSPIIPLVIVSSIGFKKYCRNTLSNCFALSLSFKSCALGFRFIFSEQLKYQGIDGDIVFGMSGSGNSKNVLEAFRVAQDSFPLRNERFRADRIQKAPPALQGWF